MASGVLIGSLFSGIGGLELGLERAGLGSVAWQVEIDPYCRDVLARHWPSAKRFGDVKKTTKLPFVDVVCGGFPCQDISGAGRGAGLAGERSGLWSEFARIVREIGPEIVIVENVASGARRWLPFVRRDLHLLGYRTRAIALSAFDVGAPHVRRRVFVVAANTDRVRLRNEQQWGPWRRSRRVRDARESVTANARVSRTVADPNCLRELGSSEWSTSETWRWSRDESGWTAEPPVCGVGHGVPDRLDRERALGNAVVPQMAEVIGRFVLGETSGMRQ